MKKDSLIYTVVFSFTVTFILVLILTVADSTTKKIVEKTKALEVAKAYLRASSIEVPADNKVEEIFKKSFGLDKPEGNPIKTKVDGEEILVAPFSGDGLWGTISGVIALSNDFSRVIGMEITSHSETPGLGGRIEEPWFSSQFRGEKIGDNGIEIIQRGGIDNSNLDDGIVDGVTGATRTSEAMEKILNNEIEVLRGNAPRGVNSSKGGVKESYLKAIGLDIDAKAIDGTYKSIFGSSKPEDDYIYGSIDGDKIVGTTFVEKGHWGDIKAVVVASGDEIIGIEIVEHEEKAGAGIVEVQFKSQFEGVPLDTRIVLLKDGDEEIEDATNLDGITGATSTTNAMQKGMNKSIKGLMVEVKSYE